ncbi:MAG: hypothetical protein PVF83_06670 [Anaerolineales bacterium]|jgi:hypothetical protein
MQKWEYCEVDFDGSVTRVWFYDEAGDYIDRPSQHKRLGVELAKLGHDGWEIISTWWRSRNQVTYMLKRPMAGEWTNDERRIAEERYLENHPLG